MGSGAWQRIQDVDLSLLPIDHGTGHECLMLPRYRWNKVILSRQQTPYSPLVVRVADPESRLDNMILTNKFGHLPTQHQVQHLRRRVPGTLNRSTANLRRSGQAAGQGDRKLACGRYACGHSKVTSSAVSWNQLAHCAARL